MRPADPRHAHPGGCRPLRGLDRTAQDRFFVKRAGGSNFLWRTSSGSSGIRGVHHGAAPVGIVMGDNCPCSTRKAPLRLQDGGRISEWRCCRSSSGRPPVPERHQSGHAPALHAHDRAHLDSHWISLSGDTGTLWKAKIRFDPPMLFCLAMLFNFLIGGVTGVFLSDVPVDVTVHGEFLRARSTSTTPSWEG